MPLKTCVAPEGYFRYGLHEPGFTVKNLRQNDMAAVLGKLDTGAPVENSANFPQGPVEVETAAPVFEISNPFPFRGTTYIGKTWADRTARNPLAVKLPSPPAVSLCETIQGWIRSGMAEIQDTPKLIATLPEPLLLSLATSSTDPEDLTILADACCAFIRDPETGGPTGMPYARDAQGCLRPVIRNRRLFAALANNPFIPDDYKAVMALTPGAQGKSEIVGEWRDGESDSHVLEYLRCNSYIPWGHYAANLAPGAVRYHPAELSAADMRGMRHLYYQRTYVRLAEALGFTVGPEHRMIPESDLEDLRIRIRKRLTEKKARNRLQFTATLWGWNFGFDYSPSHYRLHASHQQVHQQFALLPAAVSAHSPEDPPGRELPSYGCGDLVAEFIHEYKKTTGADFFAAYTRAIRHNRRMDGNPDGPASLVVYADDHVLLFVPKAQTSQWELQLMPVTPIGNIVESDTAVRKALDRGLLIAFRILGVLGARMLSVIEYPKRFDDPRQGQRLLYAFLPRLPQSPGAFSEAQLRWINGHYPEDFAAACRNALESLPSAGIF